MYGPMDAKTLKLQYRIGDLDIEEEERDIPVVERGRKKSIDVPLWQSSRELNSHSGRM